MRISTACRVTSRCSATCFGSDRWGLCLSSPWGWPSSTTPDDACGQRVHGCGRLMGSEGIWRAVLITSLAVMAVLLIVSVWAYLAAADGSIAVARDRSLEPVVPMGALTVAPDGGLCDPGQVRIPPEDDCVQAYVPLVGYMWWFGLVGPMFVFFMGLAIVYYAGGRLPAQWKTPLALVFVGLGLTVNLPRL